MNSESVSLDDPNIIYYKVGDCEAADPGLEDPELTITDPSTAAIELAIDATQQIVWTSSNAATPTFTSSNSAAVEVSAAGLIKAKALGSATITIEQAATETYMQATKTIAVTVAGDKSKNTQCSGWNNDIWASEGGYTYKFSTSGTTVHIEFTAIGNFPGGFTNPQVYLPDVNEFKSMTQSGKVLSYDFENQTTDSDLKIKGYFPREAGTDETQVYTYTVGEDCQPHPVTGVSIPETLNLEVGGSSTLTATINPSNATNKNVTWSIVSGDSYISLDQTGKVTAKAAGTAVVRVTTQDGNFTDDCTVTVTAISRVTFWGLGSNNGVDILYSITRNTNKTLTFHVDVWGDVTGIAIPQINIADKYNNVDGEGKYTTTATYETDDVVNLFFYIPFAGDAARIDVAYTVGSENSKPTIHVTSVSIDPASANVEVGKTANLTAIVKPALADNKNVSWSVTAGTQYASIDANGVVTGLAAGSATVQVTTEDGNKSATCDVNVVAQILLEPNAAPAAPTVPAEQVKAVYSATYSADCNFGNWGGGTGNERQAYGWKFYDNNYFGLVDFTHNCSQMEALHMDIWVAENVEGIKIAPINGGAPEQLKPLTLEGQKWNSIDVPMTEFANNKDFSNVYQVKFADLNGITFWVNNVYFYTTQAKTTCALSASVKNNEGGTASVDNAEVNKGESATFTAEAACGYSFVGWWNNTMKVSEDAIYTSMNIQEDLSLVAEFSFVGPSEAATVPSYDLVIPIYNEGAAEGVNMFASWGQRTSQEEVTIAGHKVMKYGNINYQGIGFENNKRDVHAMKYVHLDIWSNKEGDIRFHPINTTTDLKFVLLHLNECQWNSFNIELSDFGNDFDLTQIHQLKFDAQPSIGEGAVDGATILVQDIFFYAPNEFTLSETESNETNLTAFNGKVCDVTIARTFAAGGLYTLALPFDMTEAQVEETFDACTMYALAESYWKVEGENMYIRFAPVTEFKANTPILFTPATDLDNIVAKEVTINNAACKTATTLVTFHGTYSKMALAASNYILAADQYLYPVVGTDYEINGMRGYFSWGESVKSAPKMARVILHEEITTDNALVPAAQGATKKVMENGRFVIIRDGKSYNAQGLIIQ